MKDVRPREGLLRVGFELSTRRVWAGACRGAMAGCVMVPLLWLPAELKLHLVVEICFSSTQIIAVLLRNFTGCILEGLYCMHVKFLRFTCVGNTLRNGHQEQGSLIFIENRACRSETVPKFSKKIL